jgi:hypothetical protein
VAQGQSQSFCLASRRPKRETRALELMKFVALIMESNWQWWLIAALALVYGLAVLVFVIVTIMKSLRADDKRRHFEK